MLTWIFDRVTPSRNLIVIAESTNIDEGLIEQHAYHFFRQNEEWLRVDTEDPDPVPQAKAQLTIRYGRSKFKRSSFTNGKLSTPLSTEKIKLWKTIKCRKPEFWSTFRSKNSKPTGWTITHRKRWRQQTQFSAVLPQKKPKTDSQIMKVEPNITRP